MIAFDTTPWQLAPAHPARKEASTGGSLADFSDATWVRLLQETVSSMVTIGAVTLRCSFKFIDWGLEWIVESFNYSGSPAPVTSCRRDPDEWQILQKNKFR